MIKFGLLNSDIGKYLIAVFIIVLSLISMPVFAVMSLGGDAISFLSGTPSAQSAEEQGFYMGATVPENTYVWGNCTYWVYIQRYNVGAVISTYWGNANTWDENAIKDGYVVDKTPKVGSIMQSDDGTWGHVAYVTDVNTETGQWKISEMNAPRLNVVSTRTFDATAAQYYDFIHGKKEVKL